VLQIVGDPLRIHGVGSKAEIRHRVQELLEVVGLSPHHINRFPHEFSGGQRQRIGVARALALSPQLIVADEPVSALDGSIQAQVVNLLDDLQEEFNLTYVFIAHDLGVIRHVSDRIAVMYLGLVVEISPADPLYEQPIHPYTEALISAIPDDRDGRLGGSAERADRPRGRGAESDRPALRLSLPHSLQVRDRDLQLGDSTTRRLRRRALCRLPPPAHRPRITCCARREHDHRRTLT
jgi:ABC-type dipeptide/oligopeptide/nickel transport system ATPase component